MLIKMRAVKGDVCQLPMPISTNVYSNGSIGYNLVYPEKINTAPNKEQRKYNVNFLITPN